MTNKLPAMTRWGLAVSLLLGMGLGLFVTAPAEARSKDEFIMDTSNIGHSDHGVVQSDQLLELGTPTSNALRLEGEQSMRFGNLDRSIMVLQRAVEMDPSDMDGRILYAEALEKKLRRQKERDPVLFNFLVKQWLYIAKKADFMDQSMQGYSHLIGLTGKRPGRWEFTNKYLAKVLLPEDGKTKVALGRQRPVQEKDDLK